ncbi:GNAT family N-acetyltransferase [Halothermothrix orenii]|uniref:Acetyltransferase n=1 Tax=Halothermothrix orenii (strain H 168 / OCM 544 / DSM 9562) TaxID=373903 RepID=B8CXT3_HALOH|nr:N-acetyltransferase [Halothermothrix orenii]ACL70102.1 Acetyltransferase [Halothermothrix orenii H 168]
MELSKFRLKNKCRLEKIKEIKQLFIKTFSDSEGESEGKLIGNLVFDLMTKTDSQDLHAFIAISNKKIIGSIIFSRLRFERSQINAFLLSPVAVHPAYQGKGIGQKLINFGHTDLKKNGVELVFTYGDINFYSKVGYKVIPEKVVKAPLELSYPEGWLAQSLVSDNIEPISGNSYCVEAINKPEYW